jgi:hypothetical protein
MSTCVKGQRRAARRRDALIAHGCATYRFIKFEVGQITLRAILCLCCGKTSNDQNDVKNLYCPNCQLWHSDWVDA